MRGKTPEEMVGPARGRPTSRPKTGVSEVHPPLIAFVRSVIGRRAGGAGRRREGARATRPERGQVRGPPGPHAKHEHGAGERRVSGTRNRSPAGALPDGDVFRFDRPATSADRGF